MARLPIPGDDDGTWGTILNEFLEVELDDHGVLKIRTDGTVVHTTGTETIAGAKTFQAPPVVPTPTDDTHATTKLYVDTLASSGAAPATNSTQGIVKLAGDLAGTADLPTVPGLANKADDSAVVHDTGSETIAGVKTFSSAPVVPSGAFPQAAVTNLTTDLAAKATDASVVHNTGAESIAGVKTFSSAPVVPSGAFPQSAVTNLTSDLGAKATDTTVVHNTGAESIAGIKTFSSAPVVPSSAFPQSATTNLTTDLAAKATDASVVHNTGAESIAGVKTFSSAPVVPSAAFPQSAITNLTTDLAAKATDTTVVHNTGAESIAGVKTFSSAPVVPSGAFPQAAVTNLTTDLAAKESTANKNAAGGYAPLDGSSKVPLANLPLPLTQANSHASPDTDSGPTAIHHTLGAGANQAAAGNHTHAGGSSTRQTQLWAWDGTAQVVVGTGRWYNRTGTTLTIFGVWAAAGVVPTGANIIADVNVNGTTIFTTQGNRPTITAGTNGGALATPDVTSVADGAYITVDIDQVGSGAVGSGVTVGVVYS